MTQKGRVAPFGDPRIKGCSPLPAAFRSVPRPSSPLSAKASTKCPYALDPMRFRRTQRADPPHEASTPRLILSTSLLPAWPRPGIPSPRASAQDPAIPCHRPVAFLSTMSKTSYQKTEVGSQRAAPRTQDPVLTRSSLGRQPALVEPTGIEPVTPCLQSRCSPS
jgi:hypothetical protein